jgi:MFS family permease
MSLAALDRSTQRNLGKLFSAQALGGSSAPIILSIGGLVGQTLTPDPALATLPVSLYGIGVAVSMIPVSLLMKNAGRKIAYLTGTLLCVLAALLATTAIVNASFWLFCAALGLAGFYGACVQNYRFAASDLVPASHKPNAISLIMLGGLAAAVIGPQTVYWTQNTWASAPFAGSFIGQAILALLAIPILLSLKLPPSHEADINGDARPLWQIAKSPGFITAALAGTVSYALMSFIMTAAPIAMVHQGHSAGDATLGIQWHILAMFGPSFFHRQTDRPLRCALDHRTRTDATVYLRRYRHVRDGNDTLLGITDPARTGLELRFYWRHHPAHPHLPTLGKIQGTSPQRPTGIWYRRRSLPGRRQTIQPLRLVRTQPDHLPRDRRYPAVTCGSALVAKKQPKTFTLTLELVATKLSMTITRFILRATK